MGLNGGGGTVVFGDGRSSDDYVDLITVTFTTAEAGEYLIVANCMVGGVFASLTTLQSKLIVGGTTVATYTSPTGAQAIQPIVMAGKITLSANTSYTAAFQGQVSQDNTTPDVGGFNRRISALHLNKQ